MLAVQQRPSMGPSKAPHDDDAPFGYSFDNSSNLPFAFPSPPAPAPGPSILDDSESSYINDFFDGVSSDTFDYAFFSNPSSGSGLDTAWEELPPMFMGTSSSFGHQSLHQNTQQPQHMTSVGHRSSRMAPPPLIPATTSPDVLAAATLLQNTSNGNGPAQSLGMGTLFGSHNASPSQSLKLEVDNRDRAQPMPFSSAAHQQGSEEEFMHEPFYSDMVFGNASSQTMRRSSVSQKVEIQWGSDASFGTPLGFMPTGSQAKQEDMERSRMKAMDAFIDVLQVPSSAENTRPSSPSSSRAFIPPKCSHNNTSDRAADDEADSRRKRRKPKLEDEDDEDEEPYFRKVRKRKSANGDSPGSEAINKRRKSAAASAAAAAKATRENLTEDQKRENHIKSEQKRRTLIREGFEDLGVLVPGLKGGGFSKSTVLLMAGEYLDEVMTENEALRQRIKQLTR